MKYQIFNFEQDEKEIFLLTEDQIYIILNMKMIFLLSLRKMIMRQIILLFLKILLFSFQENEKKMMEL